jgi:hypothetical protein
VVAKAQPSISTSATASVTLGSPISDTATLSGATSDAGGTITFRLYSDASCQNEINTGLTAVSVNGNGNYNSGNFTPSAAGTYYWIASYSGDAKNFSASGACGDANESSVVAKRQPSIVTNATASVIVGDPISDSATLSGATANAGGTITFRLYSDASCQNEINTGLTPVTVNGNGSYGSGNYTPAAVGTYYWIASYSGDANNEAASGACGDPNESSLVGRITPQIATAQRIFPQDSATISGGSNPTGTVTFSLYGPSDPTCAGTAAFSETVALVGGTAATNNTTFSVTSATASQYRWKVVYSGDAKHNSVTSTCGTENFTLTIVNG